MVILGGCVVAGIAAWAFAPGPIAPLAGLITLCLALWLCEILPPFAPTLLLLAVAPLVLPGRAATLAVKSTLAWTADPVLALFFGGLAAGAAARKHKLDERIARLLIEKSGGSPRRLVALLMAGTALLSMWMSNVAAAAMMVGGARPALEKLSNSYGRREALVGLAMAANLAGMSTPVGSGPNGIAIAALDERVHLTFSTWVLFGLPLSAGLILLTYWFVQRRLPRTPIDLARGTPPVPLGMGAKFTILAMVSAISLWLGEPLFGVPAPIVSLALATFLFVTGGLDADDIRALDWSTLLLIAGGVLLGRLIESTGLLEVAAAHVQTSAISPLSIRLLLCAAAACLAALMSNTGTTALLVPIALRIDPSPAAPVLVAISASLGVPFVISTPPNAMVVGEGVRGRELLGIGLVIMLGGVILVALTGPYVLALFGLR